MPLAWQSECGCSSSKPTSKRTVPVPHPGCESVNLMSTVHRLPHTKGWFICLADLQRSQSTGSRLRRGWGGGGGWRWENVTVSGTALRTKTNKTKSVANQTKQTLSSQQRLTLCLNSSLFVTWRVQYSMLKARLPPRLTFSKMWERDLIFLIN